MRITPLTPSIPASAVRLIQVENVNGQVYTQKELIGIGQEVMAPAEQLIAIWRWRPLELGRPPKK